MTESQIKEYRIQTLSDFFQVPDDKVEQCLKDFKLWIELSKPFCDLCADHGVDFTSVVPGFIWKDDGLEGLSEINIRIPIEPIPKEAGE